MAVRLEAPGPVLRAWLRQEIVAYRERLKEGLDMEQGNKYSKVVLYGADGKEKALGEGELVFVLRAQDELAWQAVEYYADLLAGCPTTNDEAGEVAARNYRKAADEIRAIADEMRRYPKKKLPD